MEKSTKKRVRNVVLGMTSVALVAGITASLTLAFLSDKQEAVNTFTADPALTLKIYESNWDGKVPWENSADTTLNTDPSTWGENLAKSYTPGTAIPKNPTVKNTSASSEYVAIKVTYQVKDDGGTIRTITPETFKAKFATYEANLGWVYEDGTNADYFYYGSDGLMTALESEKITTPAIFNDVTPKASLEVSSDTPLTLTDVDGNEFTVTITQTVLPEFNIVLSASAVQTDNLDPTDYGTIKSTLRNLFV